MKMIKFNCRRDNMCMFCKNWLGDRPEQEKRDINYRGDGKFKISSSLCSYDGETHMSTELCRHFEKSIVYL